MAIKKRIAPPPQNQTTMWAKFEGFDKQTKSSATIDCSDKQIEEWLRAAIADDADEFVVRIAQYTPDLEPANFQAIVRFSNRSRLWASAVHDDPYQAMAQALKAAAGMRNHNIDAQVDNHVKPTQDKPRLPEKPAVSGLATGQGKDGIKPRPRLRKP